MVIRTFDSKDAIGSAAAALFAAQVIAKPDAVLGLATGSTPIPTYRKMAAMAKEGVVDFSRITTFNLDEYVGLSHDHPQSYYYFMMENLFQYLPVNVNSIHVLSGTAADTVGECGSYEQAIAAAGGVDLQILGIGHNGHIAFNEPDSSFSAVTHVVDLTESTIHANTRFFHDEKEVPRQALTMGIGSIMKSKAIVLIATGEDKAKAIQQMVHGPVTSSCPASILQFHPQTTILLDTGAASLL